MERTLTLFILVSLLEVFARTGPNQLPMRGRTYPAAEIISAAEKRNACPGVILVKTVGEANEAPGKDAAASCHLRVESESSHWKIKREVAGIVLRFSGVSTCFLRKVALWACF
jgi:hypothetical protein